MPWSAHGSSAARSRTCAAGTRREWPTEPRKSVAHFLQHPVLVRLEAVGHAVPGELVVPIPRRLLADLLLGHHLAPQALLEGVLVRLRLRQLELLQEVLRQVREVGLEEALAQHDVVLKQP